MNVIALSKVAPLFLYPLFVSIALGLIALLLLLFRKTAAAAVALVLLIATLCVAGSPWIAGKLIAAIEDGHTPLAAEDTPTADAIVLLAGVVAVPHPPRASAELKDAADRVLHSARLYRAAKAPLIIVSGGNVFRQRNVHPESFYISNLLQEWGVPQQAIVTEGKSRNTYQNALESKRILDRLRLTKVLLVTSALHMPRALAVFRSVGINAVPAVTDILVTHSARPEDQPVILDWLPTADSLLLTTFAIREHIGMWTYRWLGWIKTRN